jgi:hypothetical protein
VIVSIPCLRECSDERFVRVLKRLQGFRLEFTDLEVTSTFLLSDDVRDRNRFRHPEMGASTAGSFLLQPRLKDLTEIQVNRNEMISKQRSCAERKSLRNGRPQEMVRSTLTRQPSFGLLYTVANSGSVCSRDEPGGLSVTDRLWLILWTCSQLGKAGYSSIADSSYLCRNTHEI